MRKTRSELKFLKKLLTSKLNISLCPKCKISLRSKKVNKIFVKGGQVNEKSQYYRSKIAFFSRSEVSFFEEASLQGLVTKAMRKPENSVIPCSEEIDLNGITTVGNLTEINWTSETRKFRGNLTKILTEILMEMLNGNGTRNNCPEV